MRFVAEQRNRRSAMRHPCRKSAKIRIAGIADIRCTVLNVSSGGALVELDEPMILPRQFRLQIPEDLFEGTCERRHLNGRRMGVMFVSHLAEAFSRFRNPPLAK